MKKNNFILTIQLNFFLLKGWINSLVKNNINIC